MLRIPSDPVEMAAGALARGRHAPGECARVWEPVPASGFPWRGVDQTPASDEIQSRYSVMLT